MSIDDARMWRIDSQEARYILTPIIQSALAYSANIKLTLVLSLGGCSASRMDKTCKYSIKLAIGKY